MLRSCEVTQAFFLRWRVHLRAATIISAVVLFGFVIFHVGAATYSNYPKRDHQNHTDGCTQSCAPKQPLLSGWWDWTTHDPVAFYTSILSVFTGMLFVSTVGLWLSTRRGIRIQMDDTRILQRAYLSVNPLGIARFTSGQALFSCDVGFQNVGKLPARNVQWFIDRVFSDERWLKEFLIKEEGFEGRNIVAPGIEMRKGANAVESGSFNAAKNHGSGWLYVWGEVRYGDGFGKDRFTKFCFRYNMAGASPDLAKEGIPKESARYHVYGNDAD
jgi:hypothetical protein